MNYDAIERHFFSRSYYKIAGTSATKWLYLDFREIVWFAEGLTDLSNVNQYVLDVLQAVVCVANERRLSLFIDLSRTPLRNTAYLEADAKFGEFELAEGLTVIIWDPPFWIAEQIPPSAKSQNVIFSRNPSFALWGTNVANPSQLSDQLHSFEVSQVKDLIESTFSPFKDESGNPTREVLRSTPITTNGIFNSQKIIGNPAAFMRTCIALAALCQEAVDGLGTLDVRTKTVRLFALSPRAAPFAGVLGRLCDLEIDIITATSCTRVIEEYSRNPLLSRTHYFYVADFILGATELRQAEGYVAHWHSLVTHCICLGTYMQRSAYQRKERPEIVTLVEGNATLELIEPKC